MKQADAKLLDSVTDPNTWVALHRIVYPGVRPVLPERFITRRPATPIEIPVETLRVAAYLRALNERALR